MFTGNSDLLRRRENLIKSLEETQKEIESRMKEVRADNEGYIITQNENGKFALVAKEFYLKQLVKNANAQLHECVKCDGNKEKK